LIASHSRRHRTLLASATDSDVGGRFPPLPAPLPTLSAADPTDHRLSQSPVILPLPEPALLHQTSACPRLHLCVNRFPVPSPAPNNASSIVHPRDYVSLSHPMRQLYTTYFTRHCGISA